MRSVYNSKKDKSLANEVFYGIVDSSALNAYVIFTHNTPGFGGNKTNKRQKFLKELSKSLIIPQAKRRLITPQTPQAVKQIICSCGILPEERTSVQIPKHPPVS